MASLVEVLGDKSNVKTRGRSFLKSSPNNKLSLHWDNVHSFFVCFEDRMTSFQRAKLHITTCYWLFFFFFFFYSTWELLISWFSSSKIVFISSTETSSAPNWSAQCCLCCNLWFYVIHLSSRLRSIPPVLLPEWLLIQAASFGGEESAGPHSGCVVSYFWW